LCAESDQDRDSWIDALVRHVVPDSSHERSESKSVIVTAAQPLNNAADSKIAGAPSPSLFNSMESQRLANSSPSLASQSSHNSMPPRPLVSPITEYAPGLPDPSRQARSQSSMPPRGPPAAHTAAYLSKLSADGLNAPPGSLPDKDRERKVKSGRFWPSFGKTAEKTSRPVFGVPLQESIAIANAANLPAIVFRCIEYLEHKHAEQEEGLYRLSGSSAVIKGLKDRFDTQGDVNLRQIDEHWDPHAIAGLLKTFLRELPTSLLTSDLHTRFLAVIGELPHYVTDFKIWSTLLRASSS
jgi:RalA-binding protein 1